MRITKRTRTRDVLLLFGEDRIEELVGMVPEVPLKREVKDCTVGEFVEMLGDSYHTRFLMERRALKAFGMLKSWRRQMEEIGKYMKRFEIKDSADEMKAKAGVQFPTVAEGMLIGAMREFGLHCIERPKGVKGWFTKAAEDVKLAEYLLIVKERSADAKFQRNYNDILNSNSKK